MTKGRNIYVKDQGLYHVQRQYVWTFLIYRLKSEGLAVEFFTVCFSQN